MKNILNFVKAAALMSAAVTLFAACAGAAGSTAGAASSASQSASSTASSVQASAESAASSAENAANSTQSTAASDANSVVVYFSWSGNTDKMAQLVADETGSDIYRITPAEAYPDNYNDTADRAQDELESGTRPALDNLMSADDMAKYDTIYVGFPIWWYDLPMPVVSFLENYDLSGKTVIPFFSHNGSSSGAGSLSTLAEICTGANVLTDEALSVTGTRVDASEAEIRGWAQSVNK